MLVASGIEVLHDEKPVRSMVMRKDTDGDRSICEYKSLSWYAIKRGEKIGIRLRDREHPAVQAFEGIEYYPIDRNWEVEARFVPYDPPKRIVVPNILGTESEEEITCGHLRWRWLPSTRRSNPVSLMTRTSSHSRP